MVFVYVLMRCEKAKSIHITMYTLIIKVTWIQFVTLRTDTSK